MTLSKMASRYGKRTWLSLVVTLAAAMMMSLGAAELAWAASLSTPLLVGPIARTSTTLSVRFYRPPESNGMCQPDIGYEFKGGVFNDWHDAGGFPHAPCDDPDPGYKFSGLAPGPAMC